MNISQILLTLLVFVVRAVHTGTPCRADFCEVLLFHDLIYIVVSVFQMTSTIAHSVDSRHVIHSPNGNLSHRVNGWTRTVNNIYK